MSTVKARIKILVFIFIVLGLSFQAVSGTVLWYELYKHGLEAMKSKNWDRAKESFEGALKHQDKDSNKKRVGTMFIKYYPHRELGICYYNLGDMAKAKEHLSISLRQSSSEKARQYIRLIDRGQKSGDSPTLPVYKQETDLPITPPVDKTEVSPGKESSQLVGDRLCIAVLPFETKGIGEELGEMDLLDKLITEFVHLDRFKVIERSQLENILAEQKLGLTGVIDASTAVEVGKTAGVDVVVFGSIASDKRTVTIDARLVDTETAEIITSRDAFSKNLSLINLSEMISEVAQKIKMDLPIANGLVIRVDGNDLLIDLGNGKGIKKGMKCHVFREGEPIIHPVSGDTLDTQKELICEIQVTDVYDGYSKAKTIIRKDGAPAVGDKVQTK
ncbi:MAG: hypothetical protein GY839_21185 [candidate division Zixibacteria bacterium]|nr:hypothetical protein [candidate division Zixibacteria bacterium]